MISSDEGKKIIEEAKKYLGLKWVHQGRNLKNGVDCAGFIVEVLKKLGYNTDFDYKGYGRFPDASRLLHVILTVAERVSFEDRQDGDIILFKVEKNPQHVTFFLKNEEDDFFIHSQNEMKGGVILTRLDEHYKKLLVGIFRLKS